MLALRAFRLPDFSLSLSLSFLVFDFLEVPKPSSDNASLSFSFFNRCDLLVLPSLSSSDKGRSLSLSFLTLCDFLVLFPSRLAFFLFPDEAEPSADRELDLSDFFFRDFEEVDVVGPTDPSLEKTLSEKNPSLSTKKSVVLLLFLRSSNAGHPSSSVVPQLMSSLVLIFELILRGFLLLPPPPLPLPMLFVPETVLAGAFASFLPSLLVPVADGEFGCVLSCVGLANPSDSSLLMAI
mmetsp:Transcript_14112/g.32839  ORF Transcript_14112/g.32839 Transcript_14112/m.32839 type:complete len:237 (+) Transcript_14112:3078-3788(+)